MPQERSDAFYYKEGNARLLLADDIVNTFLTEVAHLMDAAPNTELRERLRRKIVMTLILHGVQCA